MKAGVFRCDECGSDKVYIRCERYENLNTGEVFNDGNAYPWCEDCTDKCRYTFHPEGE